MQEELEKHIRQTLGDGLILQIATASGDQPWAATVYYASDDNLNIYWLSNPNTRHSQDLAANPKTAGAIPLDAEPSAPNVGLQVQGIAGYLGDPAEIESAIRLYAKKYGNSSEFVDNFIAGKDEHKIYKLQPNLIVLLDEKTYPQNPRQEWRQG